MEPLKLYTGTVENRDDPLKLGRCQVRVLGLHTYDKSILPTADLPWAYPMQPITSAAMSGIGHSPVGPVEGTTVLIIFRDDDEQQPIIIGSVGGIPQDFGITDQEDSGMVLKKDGYAPQPNSTTVTDENGQAVTTSETPTPTDTGLAPASSYQPSQDAIDLIKKYEGVRLTAYQDSVGIWTIGYGSTRIANNPVKPGDTITQAQADQLLIDHINTQVKPAIASKVKAPITQSMFDALCSFTYNLGGGAFGRSTLNSDLNAANYTTAANDFSMYNKAGGNVLAGLTARRNAEQQLFLKDGIPDAAGELKPTESPQTPVGAANPDGTTSSGTASGDSKLVGFKDPKGKYPLYTFEPDTNRLARHEEINKTVVYKKEVARELGVATAQGRTWDQSPVPYNSKYPYNHVYMSESGHVMEFDDTVNSERVHIYHKAGTYTEIDANGTEVKRIVGDKYEILERNGHLLIKGSADVTIQGDHNVKIENALRVDISGVTTINVFNDASINVSGKMDLDVKEDLNIRAKSIKLEAYDGSVDVLASSNINEQANVINVKANRYNETVGTSHYRWNGTKYMYIGSDTYTVAESGRTDHNCPTTRGSSSSCASIDSAPNAASSGLSTPVDKENPTLPEFSELVVVTRELEAASQYETPEDGDPTNFVNKQIALGALSQGSGTPSSTSTPPPNSVQPMPASCDVLNGMSTFPPDLQLSPSYTLGDLNANGKRAIVDQMGLTKAQIVCNLKGLCENVLEKILAMYPGARITSGFRRPGDVGESSKTSQHYSGEAADIVITGFGRQQHFEAIQEIQKVVPYDKLILEYYGKTTVWIHVAFKYQGARKEHYTYNNHSKLSSGTFTLIS